MKSYLQTVSVIGAGLAGLACAGRLHRSGLAVRLFDKGRSPGGRVATRRVDTAAGPAQFDHGAQFFTARDPEFRATLARLPAPASMRWCGIGVAEEWRVAAPRISALPEALADGLDIALSSRISAIARDGGRWLLIDENGAPIGRSDAVVVAIPAEQAAPLLAPLAPHLASEAAQAETAPCWAGIFAFAAAQMSERVAYELTNHPVLGWIACDSAKPGREREPQCWVAHACPNWSRAHLEEDPGAVGSVLLKALASVLGALPAPLVVQAHRWRHARVERASGSPFGWDPLRRVGVCGDWRLGARAELAWRSGHELAGAILG
jgi:predicted NAD/FAD-dependent oxidoreductase